MQFTYLVKILNRAMYNTILNEDWYEIEKCKLIHNRVEKGGIEPAKLSSLVQNNGSTPHEGTDSNEGTNVCTNYAQRPLRIFMHAVNFIFIWEKYYLTSWIQQPSFVKFIVWALFPLFYFSFNVIHSSPIF